MIRLTVDGIDEAARRAIAPRLRGAAILADAGDAVVFLGPVPPQAATIERLLAAGTHVLLAAESCLPADTLEALSAAAQRGGVHLEVVNPDRHLPSRQLIKQQLDQGVLGAVGLVRMHRWEPVGTATPASLLCDLDVVLWLTGQSPEIVHAVEAGAGGRFVQVHLGFAGGGMALLDYSDGLPAGAGYRSLSVIGSAGAACADDHHNMQLVYRGGCPQAVRTDEERAGPWAALVQEFVDTLHAGLAPAGVPAWRPVFAVAVAVEQSLACRAAVRPEGR
jgi:predicted dehydrogenase